MQVDRGEVRRIARLARLALTPAAQARFARDLSQILAYAEQLRACAAVHPSADAGAETGKNVLRDDLPHAELPRAVALQNAPDTDGVHFRVPPVLPVRGSRPA